MKARTACAAIALCASGAGCEYFLDTCDEDSDCESGEYCAESGECEPQKGAGASCTRSAECADDLWCENGECGDWSEGCGGNAGDVALAGGPAPALAFLALWLGPSAQRRRAR